MFCFQVISLFILVGSALCWTAPNYDLANAEQLFTEFIEKYGKRYESYEEYNKRFEIFKRNLKRINEWNDYYKHENGRYVITQFSDQEGYSSCIDRGMRNTTNAIKVKREFIINAPDQLDYRDQNLVTGIKNQGYKCGSCFVFGAIGNIEGIHAKQSGELISLSEQQGLDCSRGSCELGGYSIDVLQAMIQQGCMKEEDNPYTEQKNPTCSTDPSKVVVKITGANTLNTPDVETLKGALVQNGAPLAITLYASETVMHSTGKHILNPVDCAGGTPNHAVLLVGYSTDPTSGKPYWIIKNSWGEDHGDNGYFYFDMECQCSVGTQGAFTAVA